MSEKGNFEEFAKAVDSVRDSGEIKSTAHTSSVSAEQWLADERNDD